MGKRWSRVAAAAALVAMAAGCSTPQALDAPRRVVLSVPFTGNAWEAIGQALASEYNARIPDVSAEVVTAQSLKINREGQRAADFSLLESQVDALRMGEVDLALEDAETAYVAYTRGTQRNETPYKELAAIGVMFSIAVQVVVPASTGITTIDQLKGRRVDVGAVGGSVERAARIILESYGISYDQITPTFGGADTLARFKAGDLDARFFYSAFKHPTIDSISREVAIKVLPIDRRVLGAIQERHHFLKSTTIPAGTYTNQATDIPTVGMDVLLLCRKDLPDTLVYELTRGLFDAVPALERAHEAARTIDVERGPTASIPLHPGAARYYREREILQ